MGRPLLFYFHSAAVDSVKVMLLGDSGVGKTCLLVRFRDGTFLSGNFISTVGIDFRVRRMRDVEGDGKRSRWRMDKEREIRRVVQTSSMEWTIISQHGSM